MDLAVDGLELAVGADVNGGVGHAVVPVTPLGDRARYEIDAQLCGRAGGPGDRAALLERLGPGRVVLRAAAQVEPFGEHDEVRAVGSRRAREPIRSLEVALGVVRRLELDRAGAASADGRCLHVD